jgi:hypothetical protein
MITKKAPEVNECDRRTKKKATIKTSVDEEMMMKVEGMEWGTYSGSNFFRHQTLTSIWGFEREIKRRKAAIVQKIEQEPRHKNSTTGTEVRKKDPLGRKQ